MTTAAVACRPIRGIMIITRPILCGHCVTDPVSFNQIYTMFSILCLLSLLKYYCASSILSHVAANVMLVMKDLVPSALRLIPVPNQTKAVAIMKLFVPRQGLALITAPVVLVSVVMVSAVFQLIHV